MPASGSAVIGIGSRFALLHQLAEKADDTETALGSDIITTAFGGNWLCLISSAPFVAELRHASRLCRRARYYPVRIIPSRDSQ